jgi:hypothetical protein
MVTVQSFADVFDWYYIFPHLDTPMHILGGLFVGFMALAYIPRHYNDFQKLCWVLGFVILIGFGVEIGEWALTSLFHIEIGFLLQPSIMDTIGDMIHDFVGGVIAFCYGYFSTK